jgi:hypothetical protein
MNPISMEDRYEQYLDTAGRCGSSVRLLSDEDLVYLLFERFGPGVVADFHENSLNQLFDAGLIDDEAVRISMEIRREWFALGHHSKWPHDIRTDSRWNRIFELSDDLQAILGDRLTSRLSGDVIVIDSSIIRQDRFLASHFVLPVISMIFFVIGIGSNLRFHAYDKIRGGRSEYVIEAMIESLLFVTGWLFMVTHLEKRKCILRQSLVPARIAWAVVIFLGMLSIACIISVLPS